MMRARILVLALTALIGGPALAQAPPPLSGPGTVTIVDPAQVSEMSRVGFAPMIRPGEAAGMAVEGQSGSYSIRGLAGDAVNIAMPLSVKLIRDGGVEEVLLTLTPAGQTNTILAGQTGQPSMTAFGLRGTLGVENAPPAGTYSGTYSVILSLQ